MILTRIDRNVRLLAYRGIASKWLSLTGGTSLTSGQLGTELGINPTQVRRDLQGLVVGGKRGKGYDVNLLILGIERMLTREETQEAVVAAHNVLALANVVIDTNAHRIQEVPA